MAAFPAQQAGEALHPPLAAGSGSSKGQVQTPKGTRRCHTSGATRVQPLCTPRGRREMKKQMCAAFFHFPKTTVVSWEELWASFGHGKYLTADEANCSFNTKIILYVTQLIHSNTSMWLVAAPISPVVCK